MDTQGNSNLIVPLLSKSYATVTNLQAAGGTGNASAVTIVSRDYLQVTNSLSTQGAGEAGVVTLWSLADHVSSASADATGASYGNSVRMLAPDASVSVGNSGSYAVATSGALA